MLSCLLELAGVPRLAAEPQSLSDAVIKTGPPLGGGSARVVDGDQHVIGPVSVRQYLHASQAQRIGPGQQRSSNRCAALAIASSTSSASDEDI